MTDEAFAKALSGSEDEVKRFKKYVNENEIKIDSESAIKFAVSRVTAVITEKLASRLQEHLNDEINKALKNKTK